MTIIFIHSQPQEMGDRELVFIIVPVYNDSSTIKIVVAELVDAGHENIIVVDDGSNENICHELLNYNVHYLRHAINLGQGAALQTGFIHALKLGADIIVTFDADGQHDAANVKDLVNCVVNKQADVALGSRFLKRSSSDIRLTRLFILKLARIVNFIFTGIYLSDAHNGLRVFNSKAAGLIKITENRMSHASEILFEIKKHHLVHKEIPVNIKYTAYSMGKGQSSGSSIRILLDIIIYKIFNWFI